MRDHGFVSSRRVRSAVAFLWSTGPAIAWPERCRAEKSERTDNLRNAASLAEVHSRIIERPAHHGRVERDGSTRRTMRLGGAECKWSALRPPPWRMDLDAVSPASQYPNMRPLLKVAVPPLAVAVFFACSVRKRDYGEGLPPGGTAGMGGGGEVDEGNGGAAGNQDEPLRLLTDSLPEAHFNTEYSIALEAAGGRSPFSFSIEEGALPTGVSLSEAGDLGGKPTEDGTFEFTVTVTDEAERTASAQLLLSVSRKRWLAYVADDDTLGQFLLYVLDLRDPLLPRTLLSTDIQADGDVGSFRFSADGTRLAFTADGTVDGESDIYVVDLSGEAPDPALQVNQQRPVGAFALTPDGNGIAYAVQINENWVLQFVDLSGDEPGLPVTVGPASSSSVNWVTNERVLYRAAADGHATRLRTGASFSAEDYFAGAYGNVDKINRSNKRVSFFNASTSCGASGRMLDFETGLLHPAIADSGTWPSYNDQLTRLVFSDHPDVVVHDTIKTLADPMGTFSPGTTCGFESWSPQGNRVLVQSGEHLAVVSISSGAAAGSVLGGDYPFTFWDSQTSAWANNDHVVFGAENGLYESRIVDDSPTDVALLREVGAADEHVSFLSPAPDESWVVYVAVPGHPVAMGLEDGDPEPARSLGPPTAAQTMVTSRPSERQFEMPDRGFEWSPDSSRVAYVMDQEGPSQLFVADMLRRTGNAMARSVGGCSGEAPETCRKVQAFMFQP